MKIFMYILILVGIGLIILNITKLDFDDILQGESLVALIGILAAACAIVLMLILRTSLKIKNKKE